MNINVKCYATLAEAQACDHMEATAHEVGDRTTVDDLVKELGIARENVEIVFLNGKRSEMNAVLSEGDRVGLFPAVGGM